MDELIKAIIARYAGVDGSSLRTATPGGLWLSQAPQDSAGAYVVLTPVAAPLAYTMAHTYV